MRPRWRTAIAAVIFLALGFLIGAWAVTSLGLRLPFLPQHEESAEEKQADHAAGKDEGEGENAKPAAVADVRTAKALKGELKQTIDVYGSTAARGDAMIGVSAKSEVVVRRILVRSGDSVAAGAALLEVEPSPATSAQLQLAQAEVESTTKLAQAAREKADMKLATKQDLLQAEAAQREAELKLTQAQAMLPPKDGRIAAPAAGRIVEIHVQSGAVIAANTAMVDLHSSGTIEVQIGVKPEDAANLAAGQSMQIESVADRAAHPLTGTIRLVKQTINATSKLVDVVVDPPAESTLRVGEMVRGTIETKSRGGLIVPRSAVLVVDGQPVVFVVRDQKAHRLNVRIGVQTHESAEITGEDLHEGDEVIVQGHAVLEDGAAVRTTPSSGPATTEDSRAESPR